jgi:hypothetical protein
VVTIFSPNVSKHCCLGQINPLWYDNSLIYKFILFTLFFNGILIAFSCKIKNKFKKGEIKWKKRFCQNQILKDSITGITKN